MQSAKANRHRWGVLGAAFLAVLSLALWLASALIPGWYRDNWIWESHLQAVLGAITATAATVAVFVVAARAWRGQMRSVKAFSLALALVVVVALAGLVFIRSGASLSVVTF